MNENNMQSAELHERELESEVKAYLHDKERVRKILGRVGGLPGPKQRVLNIAFITLLAASFAWALMVQEPRELPLDLALLLISLKLMLILHQNARMNHFQFWMLSSLETRLNELLERLVRAERGQRSGASPAGASSEG